MSGKKLQKSTREQVDKTYYDIVLACKQFHGIALPVGMTISDMIDFVPQISDCDDCKREMLGVIFEKIYYKTNPKAKRAVPRY